MLSYEHKYEAQGCKIIAGIDEAGRGPLAGPVVSAAVILLERDFTNVIRDSKLLSPLQRERAFGEIKNKAIIGIGIISEKIIDEINILQATRLSMKKAVSFLLPLPDFVLIDGNMHIDIAIPYESIIDGDAKSLSIACASIAAKVTRDRIMSIYHKFYPQYGFDRHKGYGTEAHIEALKKIGPCAIHRRSFKYD